MRSTVQGQSDVQLLELLRNGDRAALDIIYFRYADFLFRFSVKRLNCTDTAADLVQELFLKLWIKRDSLLVKGELRAYLTVCLRNLIIDHYSKEVVKNKYLTFASLNLKDTDNNTSDLLDYRDTSNLLQGSINALPQRMKQVFHLNKVEEYSIDEIADELNLSRQTVKNQLSAAISRLRVSLGSFLSLLPLLILFQK